jgi:hypothetical protein
VLLAIKKHEYLLIHASEELKNDKDFILTCINNHDNILKYASNELKNDKCIIFCAVCNQLDSLEYASYELKNDRDFILSCVKKNGNTIKYASEILKNDKEIALAAVQNNGISFRLISKYFKNNRDVIIAAVKNFGNALFHASKEFHNDKELILIALNSYIDSDYFNDICPIFKLISDNLKNDIEFIIDCIIINKNIHDIYLKDYNNLYTLIHNLQHNYDIKYINLNILFLNNIEYISKTKYFHNILEYILQNEKNIFIQNYDKFLNIIINNEEYLLLCEQYKIKFTSKEEFTSLYKDDDIDKYDQKEINEVIINYEEQNNDYEIIWY